MFIASLQEFLHLHSRWVYIPDDTQHLANIYHYTIHNINVQDYSEDQINAWAPSSLELTGWKKKRATIKPLVALMDNKIVGFIEFEANGHIDCFYVHHECQGFGIGSSLMNEVFFLYKTKWKASYA